MRTKIITLTVLLITASVIARVIAPFLGFDRLKDTSPYIIVACCGKPMPPAPNVMLVGGTKSDSEIQVVSFLKGTNEMHSARLQTDHELWQDENYLVFGYYDTGIFQAYEEYRVIPLGANFSVSSIAGKPLDEQLQILFQRRLDHLNRQMKDEQEEKQRLEEALKQ